MPYKVMERFGALLYRVLQYSGNKNPALARFQSEMCMSWSTNTGDVCLMK